MPGGGAAATMPPGLDALPEAASRAYGTHPAGRTVTEGIATRLNPPPPAPGESAAGGFDPTFVGMGWGHKRKLRPPTPVYSKERPGKRCNEQVHSFAERDFLKQDLPVHGPQTACSLGQTRFSRGFARRRGIDPNSDAIRTVREVERLAESDAGRQVRRERLTVLQARTGCNPLTGGPPIVGAEVRYSPTRPKLKPRLHIEKEQAKPYDRRTDMKNEVTTTWGTDYDLGRRCGIDMQRPEWTVAAQLACYDGFVCPDEIREHTALRIPRPGRRIFAARHAAGEWNGVGHMVGEPSSAALPRVGGETQQPSPPLVAAMDG